MAFRTNCTHKGCGKLQAPYIDPKTDKIYCSECDKLLVVTDFMKIQMKNNKQYREKKQVAFGCKCENCSKEDQPIVYEGDLYCKFCKHEITTLSEIYKKMLVDNIRNIKKDV